MPAMRRSNAVPPHARRQILAGIIRRSSAIRRTVVRAKNDAIETVSRYPTHANGRGGATALEKTTRRGPSASSDAAGSPVFFASRGFGDRAADEP